MKYLIYSRKSSESEDRQVLSIPAQLNELGDIATREGFDVATIYQESMSAKASGRPVFNELLKVIEKGKGYSLLVWNVDRLARNMVDGGMILELMDKKKIIEIRTYEKTYRNTPDDKFMMSLSFGIAKKYVDDLSVNVKRGNTEKLKRGEWPNHAPFGYLNDKATKSVVVDPDRSRYVPRIYELYVSGSHGFASISDRLHEEGLRTRTGRKVLKSHIQRILSSRFYTGVMERDGKLYEGKYQPLISKKTFDDAQEVMSGFSRPRAKNNTLFFPLRGFLTCETCGCMLTASLKRGHQYYYCTNGKNICVAHKKYMRENDLYEKVGDLFKSLAFTERKIELMYQSAKAQAELDGSETTKNLEILKKSLNALPERESRLLDTFLGEQTTQELYDKKSAELKHERIDLQNQIEKLEKGQPAFTLEPTKQVFLQGSRATKEFLEAGEEKKRNIVEKLLGNISFEDGKMAQIQYKSPYHILAKTPKNASNSMLLHYTTKFEHFSNTNPNSLARSQTRGLAAADGGPEPLPRISLLPSGGFAGGVNAWSGRARGTAHLPSLTAHMGRNEPFSPNANTQWSLGFSPLCGCRPLAKAIHPSASASGLFPLWLRAPRFISAALSSHSLPVGRELGAALVWGKEGILPPAPPHPRSFGFRRRTTPFLVFISEFVLSLPLRNPVTSMRVGARP